MYCYDCYDEPNLIFNKSYNQVTIDKMFTNILASMLMNRYNHHMTNEVTITKDKMSMLKVIELEDHNEAMASIIAELQ